jgi:CCR4-NOT complex subunit CAF16
MLTSSLLFFFWVGGIIHLQWRREVAFAGFDVPIQMDVSAEKMINGVAGIDPQRRAELIKV